MTLIPDREHAAIRERLGTLAQPVRLLVFTEEADCQFCPQTAALVHELAALHPRLQAEVIDVAGDPLRAAHYGIDKTPAIAVLTGDGVDGVPDTRRTPHDADAGFSDTGMRFYGVPAGYEFSTLLEAVVVAADPAKSSAALAPATRQWLAGLDAPVHLQVFVTPTCPYCPRAVHLAHRLALASPLVRADMVEASEFPDLADRYQVMGVPRTVINETGAVEGAVPEAYLLAHLQEAMQPVPA